MKKGQLKIDIHTLNRPNRHFQQEIILYTAFLIRQLLSMSLSLVFPRQVVRVVRLYFQGEFLLYALNRTMRLMFDRHNILWGIYTDLYGRYYMGHQQICQCFKIRLQRRTFPVKYIHGFQLKVLEIEMSGSHIDVSNTNI